MDAFSCEICELRFGESGANVPLAVPCGHTYCKSCLLQWERKEKSICPKCRKAFVGGVETLPHNYTLIQLLSTHLPASSLQIETLSRDVHRLTSELEAKRDALERATVDRDAAIARRVADVTRELMVESEPVLAARRADVREIEGQLAAKTAERRMLEESRPMAEESARLRLQQQLLLQQQKEAAEQAKRAEAEQERLAEAKRAQERRLQLQEEEDKRRKEAAERAEKKRQAKEAAAEKAERAEQARRAKLAAEKEDPGRRMCLAARAGNVAELASLLELCQGNVAALNYCANDLGGKTPLICAAEAGHVDSVKLLITPGVDINAKADNGSTALIYAAYEGHDKVVSSLAFSSGIDLTCVDADGRTAAEQGFKNNDEIRHIIRQAGFYWAGAKVLERTVQQDDSHSNAMGGGQNATEPLPKSTQASSSSLASLSSTSSHKSGPAKPLQDRPSAEVETDKGDAGPTVLGKRGGGGERPHVLSTPTASISVPCIHCAKPNAKKACGRCRAVRYCAADCQRAHWGVHRLDCTTRGSSKRPPAGPADQSDMQWMATGRSIWEAANINDVDRLAVLCREAERDGQSAAVNWCDEYGLTPLIAAARNGHLEAVRELAGLRCVNLNASDVDGMTAAISAAYWNHAEVLAFFFGLPGGRIDLDIEDFEGKTVYDYGNEDIQRVREFFSADSLASGSGSIEESYGEILAAMSDGGDTRKLERVLRKWSGHPAVLNFQGGSAGGLSLLMAACAEGALSPVELLAATPGVNINAKDNDGRNALMYAAYHGNVAVVDFLLTRPGLELDAVDKWGHTAIDQEYNNTDAIRERLRRAMIPRATLVNAPTDVPLPPPPTSSGLLGLGFLGVL